MKREERGLNGIEADWSATCAIDGQAGTLRYRDVDIDELATGWTFDEVAWLLLTGRRPSADELVSAEVERRARLESRTPLLLSVLEQLPPDLHPMVALEALLPLLGRPDGDCPELTAVTTADGDRRHAVTELETWTHEALDVVAGLPALVGALAARREGRPWTLDAGSGGSARQLLRGLLGHEPDEDDVAAMDTCLILQAEHGFNVSTFTARVVGSSLAPPASSLASAVSGLHGRLHGGADERAYRMARDEIGTPDRAVDHVREVLDDGRRIWGVGHRVYRVRDPRARILQELADRLTARKGGEARQVFEVLVAVEEAVQAEMAAKGKAIAANVEFYKGPALAALGVPPELFTAVFAVARSAGWAAHLLELWDDHVLYRPRARPRVSRPH
ncbi:MAG: citrate/2-methylcitrate synthase [Acidobacteriota bacterium]